MALKADSPGAVTPNAVNSRVNNKPSDERQTDTSKQNYTEVGWSNDKGSIRLGHIAKQGDVTSGVILQTPDAEHQLSLDIDGPRKGWTTSTSPGNFTVKCGSANEEAMDTLSLNAENGNILITASNGKIRLQGTDIELVAVGDGDNKGNIRMHATESIETHAKKTMINSVLYYRIATPGIGEVVANGILQMYGSIFRGVSDGCILKNSKVGGQKFALLNTALAAATIAHPDPKIDDADTSETRQAQTQSVA
tara:strand:- start:869 stop:1621 length:753 start_codon:yes stop_codon:yes gene_type:complete